MTPTHFLYLSKPPRTTFVHDATPAETAIIAEHRAFLQTLLDAGKLLIAGPCLDGAYGVSILRVTDQSEADEILRTDPAIVKGLFKGEVHPLHANLLAT